MASNSQDGLSSSPDHVWPPKPPDMDFKEVVEVMAEREPFKFSLNSQIYKFKHSQLAFKFHRSQREYDLLNLAGDCAVKTHGRCISRNYKGHITMMGFIMNFETPLDPNALDKTQRKNVMEQMISVISDLHKKRIVHGDVKPANMLLCSDGKIRLCDLSEGRLIDDDPPSWEGETTTNYISPNRCRGSNWPDSMRELAPTFEDDLYGLGLSIWELYTGKRPFEGWYVDDIMDSLKMGKTVDPSEVEDGKVRDIITSYLRIGGADI